MDANKSLLSAYRLLLLYLNSKSENGGDVGSEFLESFQALTAKNAYVPLFAESFTKLLMDLPDPKRAEEFICK